MTVISIAEVQAQSIITAAKWLANALGDCSDRSECSKCDEDTVCGYPYQVYFFQDFVGILNPGNESPNLVGMSFYTNTDVIRLFKEYGNAFYAWEDSDIWYRFLDELLRLGINPIPEVIGNILQGLKEEVE